MPNAKVKVELPESEHYGICSSTFMHPIGGDLWLEISVRMGRKHSLSPILSDSVNILLTYINHRVTVNRHCMLPAQIKKLPLSHAMPAPLQLWGITLAALLLFHKLYISISNSCATKVLSILTVSTILYFYVKKCIYIVYQSYTTYFWSCK